MKGFFDRFRAGLNPSQPTGAGATGLMGVVMACFKENGWKFRPPEQANLLQFGFGGKHANYEGDIIVEEVAEEMLVLFRAPNKAPECRRLATAELLARANFGMKFGALELNYNDGEVRFKMSAVLREGQLSPKMVHAMVGISFTTFDRHYPALMAVWFGNELPSEALQAVRNPSNGEAA